MDALTDRQPVRFNLYLRLVMFLSMKDLGNLKMTSLFLGEPTVDEIHKAQLRAGFGSNGFPSKIERVVLEDPKIFVGKVSIVNFNLQGAAS